jgi:predicted transposase YbfD/YdcC
LGAQNHLVLGQVEVAHCVDDKSNEITALPKLLQLLVITRCLVTIDAMGCQTEIAEHIINQGGAYLLAVKQNQKHLHEDIVHLFKHATAENFAPEGFNESRTMDKGHGRLEIRHCQLIADPDWLSYLRQGDDWKGLHRVVEIQAERRLTGQKKRGAWKHATTFAAVPLQPPTYWKRFTLTGEGWA